MDDSLDAIMAADDPAARNRAITALYVRLSRRTAGVVGGQDANWLTFGAWASASAGRFIRGDELPVDWGADRVPVTPGLNDFPELVDAFQPYARAAACSDDPARD